MAFLDQKELSGQYEDTKNYMRQFFQPLDEFERLARNRPHPNIDKNLPKVTDGTLAAVVQEQPKRVLQQIPTGKVNSILDEAYGEMANHVLTEILLPMSKTQGNVLQKSWNMVGKALTYGVQPSYTYFTSTGDRMHTDFVLPYIKDVFPERGKVFAPDSNYQFLRAWYTKSDIQAIIAKEKKLMDKDKTYKPDWDLNMLSKLVDSGSIGAKDAQAMTPAEKEKGVQFEGIEIIHAFQKGVGADFYTFAPSLDKEQSNVLRTKKNPDPRGEMPIDWLYCNIDLSNPLGRGAVELSGGVQNLIDNQMVMFQFLSTMMMGPPLQLWGNVNKSSIKFRPNAIWDMGSNPTNKIEPYAVNNQAITNFPQNYGLLKSQILNLNSSLDTSVSAESGNPGFSKVPAGVKAQQQRLSISDNYMRKQFETWFGEQCETALNIFFAEMEGTEKLELSRDKLETTTLETLKEFYDEKSETLKIPYSKIKDTKFQFTVDPSSSEEAEDTDNATKLTAVLELATKVPDPQVQQTIPALFKKIVEETGINGISEIFPEKDTFRQLDAEVNAPQIMDPAQASQIAQLTGTPQGQVAAGGAPAGAGPAPQAPKQLINYKDAPEDIKRQMEAADGYQPSQQQQGQITPETIMKAQDQEHRQQLERAKLALEASQMAHDQTLGIHQATQPVGGDSGLSQ
mgnify:FL=1